MRRLIYFAAALALLVPAAAQPVAAQPATPQEITVNVLQGEPDNIDPNRSSFATEAAVVRQVFQTLFRFDERLVPRPAAASGLDVSFDGRVYTFTGIRGTYSDGVPVRAQDFEYSFKRILDPALAAEYASFLVDAGIVGAEDYHVGKVSTPDNVGVRALDDQTLEIRLDAPFGPFLNIVSLWVLSPIRQDIIASFGEGWTQDTFSYRGNGPFMMREWVHQDHITLIRNPFYQPTELWPTPTLETVTFLMVSDASTDFNAYLAGERDWGLVPDANVRLVRTDPNLTQEAIQYNELVSFWVHLNNAKAPLNNVLVRKALARAIDRDALIRDIANGVGLPATSLIPPGMPGFQEGLGTGIAFDPGAARELLAQAGFPNGRGFPNLTYSFAQTTANQRRAEFLQAQWKQNLNINIQLNSMETKAYQAAFKAKNYELAFGGWGADYPDPQNWFNTLWGCTGGNNKYNYCSPEFDALVARADKAVDLDERLVDYARAQQVLVDGDLPVVPLFFRGRLVVKKPHVQGMTITAQDDYPGDWFLDRISIAPH